MKYIYTEAVTRLCSVKLCSYKVYEIQRKIPVEDVPGLQAATVFIV